MLYAAPVPHESAERERLEEDLRRVQNWRRWGPYLADRQWGTVREDYSPTGECWTYLSHDHARSRAYRWGEDGLLGICDRECRICFGVALWNGKDPILKERLFGLTGPEGNHGEDCKELYYHLDATPTSSYLKALYKYPQVQYPYAWITDETRKRGKGDAEFEIEDTGVFDKGYWDLLVEYAKDSPDDILIRYTVTNRGPVNQQVHLLPQIWLRNTWSWGRHGEGYDKKGTIERVGMPRCACRSRRSVTSASRWMATPASSCSPTTRRTWSGCTTRRARRSTPRTRSIAASSTTTSARSTTAGWAPSAPRGLSSTSRRASRASCARA